MPFWIETVLKVLVVLLLIVMAVHAPFVDHDRHDVEVEESRYNVE